MKWSLLLIWLLTVAVTGAQNWSKKDTSFSVYNTYIKEKKKYPFIELASPKKPAGVAVIENVVYCTIGHRQLLADVYYPSGKNKKLYPGILLIHGGGWKSGDKSHFVPMAQQLAAKGYVAVAVEYRLSPEALYPAALHDVKAAVRWMRANSKKYGIDTSKIAALGVSAGGQLAALLGATNGQQSMEGTGGYAAHSSAVQAIIDMDGILAFKHPESAEGVVAGEWLGGTYEEKQEAWEAASALTHAGKNTPPVLFINSSNPRFHAGMNDFIHKLNTHNIYTEVHTLPDTPHPFWFFHPWFTPTMNYTVDFLNRIFKRKSNTGLISE